MSTPSPRQAPPIVGLTLQVYVPPADTEIARDYYTDLFGRPPDFVPHDDFFEWAPFPGQECWFQVSGKFGAAPLQNRVRFRVTDLSAAANFLDQQRIAHSPMSQLPEVVAFLDFSDPWGNQLGYYQDLAPSGQQTEYPGTSVTEVTQFTACGNA